VRYCFIVSFSVKLQCMSDKVTAQKPTTNVVKAEHLDTKSLTVRCKSVQSLSQVSVLILFQLLTPSYHK
jgi:hypothetical protein